MGWHAGSADTKTSISIIDMPCHALVYLYNPRKLAMLATIERFYTWCYCLFSQKNSALTCRNNKGPNSLSRTTEINAERKLSMQVFFFFNKPTKGQKCPLLIIDF